MIDKRHEQHRKTLNEISIQDRITLQELEKKAEDLKASRIGNIQDHFDNIKRKIKELQDEKHQVLRLPQTREELLRFAKAELRKNRNDITMAALRKHLETCQRTGGLVPFSPVQVRVDIFDRENGWKLAFLAITEKDIEELVAELPDVGISEKERATRVNKIDLDIAALAEQLAEDSR